MKVEFRNIDGGEIIHETYKEDISSYVNFLKSIDNINIYLGREHYYNGTIDEFLYDIRTDENNISTEVLQVFVYDFRDRQRNEKNKTK